MKMCIIKKGENILILTYIVIYCLMNVVICDSGKEFITETTKTKLNLKSNDQQNGKKLNNDELPAEHIQEQCIAKCPDQNRTNSEHLDCDRDCYITQCVVGCKLWKQALRSSCKGACNITTSTMIPASTTTEESKILYCIMGCNNGLSRYFNWIRDEVGTPAAPALVAETLTATSLSLKCEIPEKLIQLTKGGPHPAQTYLVQWLYEEVVGDWKFCRNQSMGDNSTVKVDNLQPYTKYRFRVAFLLSRHHTEFIYSEQSVIINTLPMGVPKSEPAHVRAVAVDHTRISVSWEPGPFPNGPILSYVLEIEELAENGHTNGFSSLKDLPANDNSYLFEKLKPLTTYRISTTIRNAVGEGPAAMIMITTLAPPNVTQDEPKTTLILAAEYSVLVQGSDLLSDPAQTIFNSTYRLLGIAIHIAKKLIFISDEMSFIHKIPLESPKQKEIILSPDAKLNFSPMLLSMDWLNDHLYILGEVQHTSMKVWQISRCNLDSTGMAVVLGGLQHKPIHIEVDPYNGYLFYAINDDTAEAKGIFRLDLGDVSNGVKYKVKLLSILPGKNLGAFALDHVRFRIFVPLQDVNTMISVDLDGKRDEDIRNNTQTPRLSSVKSLAVANQFFYWTNGDEVLNEEYHETEDKYYHNVYPDLSNRTFVSVCVNLPSAQPIPVPFNPPINVQALLGTRKGKVAWHLPHLLGIQGKGAWQHWMYELEVTDEDQMNMSFVVRNITTTHYTIDHLRPNINYRFRVAAYSEDGNGPWSSEFHTKSLKLPNERQILWSTKDGLVRTDILGEHVHILIPKNDIGRHNISDITWFKDIIYFISNNVLRYYNLTNGYIGQLDNFGSVQNMAIDWIGKRIYWFDPSHQIINRANLFGYEQERLFTPGGQDTVIQIDSLNGDLYVSTAYSVEYCRLNGRDKMEYYRAEEYSGKHVMGLTLDMDNDTVYWIVKSYEGTTLFSAPMMRRRKSKRNRFSMLSDEIKEYELNEKRMIVNGKKLKGPLRYFSDRLLWLNDDETVIVSNMTGKNIAHIKNSKLTGLGQFTILDQTHHYLPHDAHGAEINVIPESVDVTSIRIVGTWNSFNITWNPIKSVNYGDIFYEIRYRNSSIIETKFNSIHCNDTIAPYTPLDIVLRASTYWANSKYVRVTLHSPSGVPSAPENPRVFIKHEYDPILDDLNIRATFRWDEPIISNGPIEGYNVTMQCKRDSMINDDTIYADDDIIIDDDDDDEDDDENVNCSTNKSEFMYITATSINTTEIVYMKLANNTNYSFKVSARTAAGYGNETPTLIVNTNRERTMPIFLTSTDDEIYRIDYDTRNRTQLVSGTGYPITEIGHIDYERILFWFNDIYELYSYQKTKIKLLTLTSRPLSLCVDWVERVLYWSQLDIIHNVEYGCSLYAFDLNRFADQIKSPPIKLLKQSGYIYSLLISPIDRTIFWVETINVNDTIGELKRFELDEQKIDVLHPSHNCPIATAQHHIPTKSANDNLKTINFIHKIIALDQSSSDSLGNNAERKIVWQDQMRNLFAMNINGRHPNICIKYNYSINNTIKHLYSNNNVLLWKFNDDNIYMINTTSDHHQNSQLQTPSKFYDIPNITQFSLLYQQRYPNGKCLIPIMNSAAIKTIVPMLLYADDHSLTLRLPVPQIASGCNIKLLPTIKYTIKYIEWKTFHYNNCNNWTDVDSVCMETKITYNRTKQILNLKPFTRYLFKIGINNYYGVQKNLTTRFGPITEFVTAIGKPSVPRNLIAEVISPSEAFIQWLPPLEYNGDSIWYEIHWITQNAINGVKNRQQLFVTGNYVENDLQPITKTITKLLPKQLYGIWVRAYTSNETFSESDRVDIETLPEPNNITVFNRTAYSLCINWKTHDNITKYILEYKTVTHGNNRHYGENYTNVKIFDSSFGKNSIDINSNELNNNNNITDNNNQNDHYYNVLNLEPKTEYTFSILLYYTKRNTPYIWPPDSRFTFTTLGDIPTSPGKPVIRHVTGNVYKISWDPSKDNGAQIDEYSLEALYTHLSNHIVRRSTSDDKYLDGDGKNDIILSSTNNTNNKKIIDDSLNEINKLAEPLNYTTMLSSIPLSVEEEEIPQEKWIVQYNGTDTYWIIENLQPITRYAFRVRARNAYGWSSYSTTSEPVSEPFVSAESRNWLLIAIFVPILTIIFLTSLIWLICVFLRGKNDKKQFNDHQGAMMGRGGGGGGVGGLPDVELANLRELPRGVNLVHTNNLLYSAAPLTDADVALLPQIRRDQITMANFLGSGAFGEVYEGYLKDIDYSIGDSILNDGHIDVNGLDIGIVDDVNYTTHEVRVAIKTLRKGATEQEKAEFLQEAKLMSNFKHEHILRLIGVCFDFDALYIIMELMQGGDLLSFLRQSRPTAGIPSSLTLFDLISMCVDIASGCRYLEEMHFVHRDLACRNCLVSSVDPHNRVVKIGDFGLARDIYRNDYYRKDGEGLLPVRWMSPESLVDGVFTSQSDIWAFGVICWEILTLGQQPYPARNNLEVLNYVRNGGRLGRPGDCPEELYELMLKCWSYKPEQRPSFRYCLEELLVLQKNTYDSILITNDELNGVHKNGGIFNRSYLLADENYNNVNEGISNIDRHLIEPPILITPTSSGRSTPIQQHLPKYLEILYDENDELPPPVPTSSGQPSETPSSVVDSPHHTMSVTQLPQIKNSLPSSSSSSHVKKLNGYEIPISSDTIQLQNQRDSGLGSNEIVEKERSFSSSSTVSEISVKCPSNNIISNNNSNNNNTNNNNSSSQLLTNLSLPTSSLSSSLSTQCTVAPHNIINCNNHNTNCSTNCSQSTAVVILPTNPILKVTLPNQKEDCSSAETLLLKESQNLHNHNHHTNRRSSPPPQSVAATQLSYHNDKIRPFYTNANVKEVFCINNNNNNNNTLDGKTML